MMANALSRRGFLRICLLSAGTTLTAACQSSVTRPIPTIEGTEILASLPTMTPPLSTTQLGSRVIWSGGDAEIWAWNRRVRGTLENPGVCQAVLIERDGRRLQAKVEGTGFSVDIPVLEGDNQLVAICETIDAHEEISPMITYTGRLKQRPTAIINPTLADGLLRLDGGESRPDELELTSIREYHWSPRPDNPAPVSARNDTGKDDQDFVRPISGKSVEIDLPPVDGEYYFTLRVVDEAGREDASTTYVVVEEGRPRIPNYDKENPIWIENAIVYGIIPRLFGSPGAKAIEEKLDYLADLGVNTLWLAPINATIDYGYSVVDYFQLRQNFGTKEDFLQMVQAAHARGIRVLMDFVPNHSSREHPYFQDTLERGPESPYWDFYDRDEQGNYTYYFDWTHLPNLNYDNPEVWRWMIEAFSYWVREFDVDGFRVDAAWGIRERRPDFWPEWRQELKRIKPDLLLLTEASARDPYYFDNGFDAAYDWTDQLGKWAWGRFWAEDAHDFDQSKLVEMLKTALTNPPSGYHPDALIFRFLNNNDTGTRFVTTHGPEMTQVATALLLTLPGVPCIYTGDEVGEWFRPYFDPAPLSWKERYPGLRDYHKRLVALRKEVPSLRSRLWQLIEVRPGRQVLGFLRYLPGNRSPVLVLLNFWDQDAGVEVSLPADFRKMVKTGLLEDLLSGQPVAVQGPDPLRLQIPAYQAIILNFASQPS
jgi:cyclomaltodextrinase / maltogenic alpha-amylase / neopullulanase